MQQIASHTLPLIVDENKFFTTVRFRVSPATEVVAAPQHQLQDSRLPSNMYDGDQKVGRDYGELDMTVK